MEAEIIPMCEDQGMAIVPWAALGGGQLISTEQRKTQEETPGARQSRAPQSENDLRVCEALEKVAKEQSTTLQAVVSTIICFEPSSLTFRNRLLHIFSNSRLMSSLLLASTLLSTSKQCPTHYG